jgi:hypothetical protein
MKKLQIQDFTNAFDANKIPYRIESDGSLTLDCPVCALENKGDGKAKIFANGGFTCYRFAGIAPTEHKREMLAEWELDASSKPASFMSEEILEGTLTFEIGRGDRGKQKITARNCDSVLHIDTFNLADSSARVKFLKNLNLNEADAATACQTLINLADRFSRVDAVADGEKEPVLTTFAVLKDGRILEETTSGFAVFDPATKATTIENSVIDEDGVTYKPLIKAERATR